MVGWVGSFGGSILDTPSHLYSGGTMTRKGGDTDGGSGKSAGKRSAVGENYDAVFKGYINLNLSAEQKGAFDRWAEGASPWEALEAHVADGVNLSLKVEPKSGGFLASATQRRVSSQNAGLVVTARGGDATKALLRVLFCLVILSHAERWEDVQPLADPDRW